MENERIVVVSGLQQPVRVDKYLASVCTELSRSLIASDLAHIEVDGVSVRNSHKIRDGQTIRIAWTEQPSVDLIAQDIPLSVLYEDDSILVIDKLQSMVVHPAPGNPDGTLVNALVHRFGTSFSEQWLADDPGLSEDDEFEACSPSMMIKSEDAKIIRPGIVHRLDKDTSGVMVIAKTRAAHANLSTQFHDRVTEKQYLALVKGRFKDYHGEISTGIARSKHDRKRFEALPAGNGKYAFTRFFVLRQFHSHALVRVQILTGRTHQIRVHMAHIGHPILGDPIYGRPDKKFPEATLMLHAFSLTCNHPVTGLRCRFRAPLPPRFKTVIHCLAGQNLGTELFRS